MQRLTSSVAQRLLVDLCNIKVVLALPLQSVHGTENAADAFQAWLSWSIRQEIKIGQVSDGLDFHWHMLHWCQLASSLWPVLHQLIRTGSDFSWSLRGMPFFAIPTGEHAGAFFGVTPLDECTYDVHAVGDFPLASLRFLRLRSPFTAPIKLLQGSSWAGDLLMSIIGLPKWIREKPKVPLVPFPLKARTLTSHTSADNSLLFTVRAT